jgi:PleD family two-component response regulator
MDVQHLSEADLHLVFGLLLKKKRTPSQARKVLSILRSEMDLPAKLEAIVKVSRVQVLEIGGARADGRADATRTAERSRESRKRRPALVIDIHAEVTRLLKKCSLKRDLTFTRAAERFDALDLVAQLRPRLIIVNEVFDKEEEYARYFEICRAVEPGVRIVYLGTPARVPRSTPAFQAFARFLAKPLNIEKLQETVRGLLEQKPQPQL